MQLRFLATIKLMYHSHIISRKPSLPDLIANKYSYVFIRQPVFIHLFKSKGVYLHFNDAKTATAISISAAEC